MRFIIALLIALLPSQSWASALTAKDVRALLAMAGLNPGTSRLLNTKGVHQITKIKVVGNHGHFTVTIWEREIQ